MCNLQPVVFSTYTRPSWPPLEIGSIDALRQISYECRSEVLLISTRQRPSTLLRTFSSAAWPLQRDYGLLYKLIETTQRGTSKQTSNSCRCSSAVVVHSSAITSSGRCADSRGVVHVSRKQDGMVQIQHIGIVFQHKTCNSIFGKKRLYPRSTHTYFKTIPKTLQDSDSHCTRMIIKTLSNRIPGLALNSIKTSPKKKESKRDRFKILWTQIMSTTWLKPSQPQCGPQLHLIMLSDPAIKNGSGNLTFFCSRFCVHVFKRNSKNWFQRIQNVDFKWFQNGCQNRTSNPALNDS